MGFSILQTISQLLVGSSQSKTAAIAIIIAFISIALSILLNEVDLNLVERFGLIGVIILFALPSILFGLIDLTCISTKTMEKSFCWYYGWIISIIIIIICILVVFSSIMSMVNYNFIANQTKEIVVDEKEANKIANDLLNDSVEIKENVNNTKQYNNNQQYNNNNQQYNNNNNQQYNNNQGNYLLEQFNNKSKKKEKEKEKKELFVEDEEIEGFVNGGEYQSL